MFTTKAAQWSARTGSLVVNGVEIPTPNFIVSTTRGAIDHLTPDHAPCAPVSGVYAEDFFDQNGLVKSCVAERKKLPLRTDLLLGACRRPGSRPITNKPNTMDSFGIDTVQGSRLAPIHSMTEFMAELKPDLFLVPYDIPAQTQHGKVGNNRVRKMETRSAAWIDQFITTQLEMGSNPSKMLLIVQFPPELRTKQYIAEVDGKCDAYCFTPSEVTAGNSIPQELFNSEKPRLSYHPNINWRQVLDEIAAGFDLVLVPLTQFADAGHALTLQWSSRTHADPYIDLNDSKYVIDSQKLGDTDHSLAYIHHLLDAEEMTAQVLLQTHNMTTVTRLFEEIRQSIERGTFEADRDSFLDAYKL